MKIAFLACDSTLPGAVDRRVDAFEHDFQVAALRPALRDHDAMLVELDWRAAESDFGDCDAAIIGTTWDYEDQWDAFIARLEWLEARMPVFNSSELVKWNIDKSYLRSIETKGGTIIPTQWVDRPTITNINDAMAQFDTDRLVVKKQIGAGARDQILVERDAHIDENALFASPAMLQPFLPQIRSEGEYSFIFVDGAFSHALIKRPQTGDYRIQSAYGGTESAVEPQQSDLDAAKSILTLLPDQSPLYARIDMLRGPDGNLLLMEAELIEPYLYPQQGPDLGRMLADAIIRRLA
ncbi:MAG: hypothetical protein CME88_10805 [Hirschia sp.]|nr:hypothetical protein [Hirschia sp.]MBF18857.1 hypothetical protein [Hirschia sp.]